MYQPYAAPDHTPRFCVHPVFNGVYAIVFNKVFREMFWNFLDSFSDEGGSTLEPEFEALMKGIAFRCASADYDRPLTLDTENPTEAGDSVQWMVEFSIDGGTLLRCNEVARQALIRLLEEEIEHGINPILVAFHNALTTPLGASARRKLSSGTSYRVRRHYDR